MPDTLQEQLNQALIQAMKSGDETRKRSLRAVKTAITTAEKNGDDTVLNDDDIIDIIRQQAKQRKDSIEAFRLGGRDDLVEAEMDELAVLEEYLPALMDEDAIRDEARAAIDDTGATTMREMGKVMGLLMSRLQGRADGRQVNEIVRELLS